MRSRPLAGAGPDDSFACSDTAELTSATATVKGPTSSAWVDEPTSAFAVAPEASRASAMATEQAPGADADAPPRRFCPACRIRNLRRQTCSRPGQIVSPAPGEQEGRPAFGRRHSWQELVGVTPWWDTAVWSLRTPAGLGFRALGGCQTSPNSSPPLTIASPKSRPRSARWTPPRRSSSPHAPPAERSPSA
jgi:hypothetical protein